MARQQKQAAVEASIPLTPVKPLFDRVAAYLDANDWNYTANEKKKFRTKTFALEVMIILICKKRAAAVDVRPFMTTWLSSE